MKLSLQVHLHERSGFCHGVADAVLMAETLLEQGHDVYCVGNIVHNPEEVRRLELKGLRTVTREDLLNLKGKTVLFRAHGEPPPTYNSVKEGGHQLFDGTCKVVLKLQERIRKALAQGEFVILFGNPAHPEVISLAGQGKVMVVNGTADLNSQVLPPEVTLFSQTTKSIASFREVAEALREKGIRVKVRDTICRQVSGREENLAEFASQQDVVVFVAGKESSNGKVLFGFCQSSNPRSYFISYPDEIQHSWFSHGQKVGVAGATSTPLWLIQRVKEHLQSL